MATKRPAARGKASPAKKPAKKTDANPAAAKSTVSGPPKGARSIGDPAASKMEGTQKLAASFPVNANKAKEYGEAARRPKPGRSAEPGDPAVTGSTLTEGTT